MLELGKEGQYFKAFLLGKVKLCIKWERKEKFRHLLKVWYQSFNENFNISKLSVDMCMCTEIMKKLAKREWNSKNDTKKQKFTRAFFFLSLHPSHLILGCGPGGPKRILKFISGLIDLLNFFMPKQVNKLSLRVCLLKLYIIAHAYLFRATVRVWSPTLGLWLSMH